jgi:hypothetical protein
LRRRGIVDEEMRRDTKGECGSGRREKPETVETRRGRHKL